MRVKGALQGNICIFRCCCTWRNGHYTICSLMDDIIWKLSDEHTTVHAIEGISFKVATGCGLTPLPKPSEEPKRDVKMCKVIPSRRRWSRWSGSCQSGIGKWRSLWEEMLIPGIVVIVRELVSWAEAMCANITGHIGRLSTRCEIQSDAIV